jgi:hypothetical protein
MINVSRPSPRWLPVHTFAIGFSLSHLILDWHFDLFGPLTTSLSTVQALVLVVGAAVYALWASSLTLASQGSRRGMIATLVLCGVGGLGNGFSIVACLPPCPAAFPFGDISHVGSLVFGVWAMIESWQTFKQNQFVQ